MVRRLVDGEELRSHPKTGPDLGTLPLTVAQRLPPIEPIVFDSEAAASPVRLPVDRLEEGPKLLHRLVGSLRAMGGETGSVDPSDLRREFATGEPEERRLAGPVGADDAGPALREPERDVRQQTVTRRVVGERDVLEHD